MLTILLTLLLLVGCSGQNDAPSNRFKAEDVGVAMVSEIGTVLQRRTVTISGAGGGQKKVTGAGAGIGAVAGATLGALASDSIGGAIVGGAAGGILGGVAESASASGSDEANGYEYTIKLRSSGQVITVIQPRSVDLAVGQKVVVSRNTRTNAIRLEATAYVE